MKTSRKQIENWFLKHAYDNKQFIHAEMLEAMVATFVYLYEQNGNEVELEVMFCLNHYDTIDMYEFTDLYLYLLKEAYSIAYESHEGYAEHCDCYDEGDDNA